MKNIYFRLGSKTNLFIILSLTILPLYFNSCTVQSLPKQTNTDISEKTVIVDQMSTFQSEDTVVGYPVESKGFPKKRY